MTVYFQLRRIGKTASIKRVPDVMVLKSGINKFGRHSGNDFYMDSSKLEHFISRWHAEIHVSDIGTSDPKYLVVDKGSVNGSYINHYRVDKEQRLKENDILVFGHTNGKNIKPGEYAQQSHASSEFMFVFERQPSQDNVITSTTHGENIISSTTYGDLPGVRTSNSDLLALSTVIPSKDTQANTPSKKAKTVEVPTKSKKQPSANKSAKKSSEKSPFKSLNSSHHIPTEPPENGNTNSSGVDRLKSKEHSKSKSGNVKSSNTTTTNNAPSKSKSDKSGSKKAAKTSEQQCLSDLKSSSPPPSNQSPPLQYSPAERVKLAKRSRTISKSSILSLDSDDSSADSDFKGDFLSNTIDTIVKNNNVNTSKSSPATFPASKTKSTEKSAKTKDGLLNSRAGDQGLGYNSFKHSINNVYSSSSSDSSDSESELSPAYKRQKKTVTKPTSKAEGGSSPRGRPSSRGRGSSSSKPRGGKSSVTDSNSTSVKATTNSQPSTSKRTARNSTSSRPGKRKHSVTDGDTDSSSSFDFLKPTSKKQATETNSIKRGSAGRQQKGRGSGARSPKGDVRRETVPMGKGTSAQEDWYYWHMEGDKCEALHCRRPSNNKVSWVQCDDCDKWYHTGCVRISYDNVKDEDAEFHCGCS